MDVLVVLGKNLESMNKCWLQDWEKEGKKATDLIAVLEMDIKDLEAKDLKLKDLSNKDKVAEKLALKIKEVLKDTVKTIKNIYQIEEDAVSIYQLTKQLNKEEEEKVGHLMKELSESKKRLKSLKFTLYLYATEYTDEIYDLLTKDGATFFKNFPHEVSVAKKDYCGLVNQPSSTF